MKVKFAHTVIFVKDIEESKKFYMDVLGIKLIQDYGIFLLFENNFSLHQAKELTTTVFKKAITDALDQQGKKNLEIYFECNNLEQYYEKLKTHNIEFIHGIEMQSWGQRVFRFYDPDMHIIEVGEPSFEKFD